MFNYRIINLLINNWNTMTNNDLYKVQDIITKLKLNINELDELDCKLFKESIKEKINSIDYELLKLINFYKNIMINSDDYTYYEDPNVYNYIIEKKNKLNNEIIKLKLEYYIIVDSKLIKINNLELNELKLLLYTNNKNIYLKIIIVLLLYLFFLTYIPIYFNLK